MFKAIKLHKYMVVTYFFLILFWIALTNSIETSNLVIGFIISFISLLISKKYFFRKIIPVNKLEIHHIVKYIFVLFHQIWTYGIKAMRCILTLKCKVQIYHINTVLKDEFLIFVLANTISLTPGSVTIYRDGKSLYVLSLFDYGDNKVASRIIKHPFEDILLEVDK